MFGTTLFAGGPTPDEREALLTFGDFHTWDHDNSTITHPDVISYDIPTGGLTIR